MIKVQLTNEMINRIIAIEEKRFLVRDIKLPQSVSNKLRKNSKKKSTYASNKIEGNPLSLNQVERVIEDNHRHNFRPEVEVRNYFLALNLLEEKLKSKEKVSLEMILEVQALVEKGASKEKIGLRGMMPYGVLFAVYDSISGEAEYIPPEYSDVPGLLDDLIDYIDYSDDHPLIKAAMVHYQLVTIHPFEDGNGRVARLISGYLLDYYGYDFKGIGSLEEYFSYDIDEYYKSLQMGLPALYYSGRNKPPHMEIWLNYYLRMFELYATKVCELAKYESDDSLDINITYLNDKEKEFLVYLLKNNLYIFKPIDVAKKLNLTNKTIINRCVSLVNNGFLVPNLVNMRIRSYSISEYAISHKDELILRIESN